MVNFADVKHRAVDIFLSLMLCAFLNFVFSNTVFLHTHHGLDGRPYTHSHPYLPSGADHGHTSASLDQIAAFNASATSMVGSETVMSAICTAKCVTLTQHVNESNENAVKADIPKRGPPELK